MERQESLITFRYRDRESQVFVPLPPSIAFCFGANISAMIESLNRGGNFSQKGNFPPS